MSSKKLIEVALPLDAINKASAREKSIRHGHPSTLHLWWARRPLAAARADLFPTEKAQEKERQRLFHIVQLDDSILAIVEFAVDDTHRVHYIRRPFRREPDFGAASVNYEFGELLARAEQTW
jgi:adenine-specific DNA methylase